MYPTSSQDCIRTSEELLYIDFWSYCIIRVSYNILVPCILSVYSYNENLITLDGVDCTFHLCPISTLHLCYVLVAEVLLIGFLMFVGAAYSLYVHHFTSLYASLLIWPDCLHLSCIAICWWFVASWSTSRVPTLLSVLLVYC